MSVVWVAETVRHVVKRQSDDERKETGQPIPGGQVTETDENKQARRAGKQETATDSVWLVLYLYRAKRHSLRSNGSGPNPGVASCQRATLVNGELRHATNTDGLAWCWLLQARRGLFITYFMSSAETTVSRLQGLIIANDIRQLEVYRHSDNKLYNRSGTWSFGHEYIQVGDESYNLGRMVTFLIVDACLCLYF